MSDSTVTKPAAFQEGSLGIQIVLFIVTGSLYGIYWLYKVNSQLAAGTDAAFGAGTRTILSLIPVLGLYWIWQTCNDAEAVTDQSGGLLFVLFLIGLTAPLSWFWIQTGINDVASGA